jgi:OOP family OmpA-OmpF porin
MLKTRIAKPLVAAALLAGMAGAHADGLYVGGALGAPNYSNLVNGYGTGDGGGRGPTYKLFGGYQITPNFAVEGSAFNLGRTAPTPGSARVYGVSVDAVGSVPLGPRWSLLGSAGLAEARFTTPSGNDSSPGLKAGVGVQYDLSSAMAVRLGYDRYHFTNAFDTKPNVGNTFVGLKLNY